MRPNETHVLFILIFFSSHFCANVFAASVKDLKKSSDLNNAAVAKMKAGDLDGAEADLLGAMEYSDQQSKVKKNLGVVYYEKGVRQTKAGDFYGAEKYLKAALETDPANEHYTRALAGAYFTEAENLARRGRSEGALTQYEKALQFDGNNIHVLERASYHAWRTQHLEIAQRYLDRAKAIDPLDKDVLFLEGKMTLSASETSHDKEVSEHFILSADPDYMVHAGAYPLLGDLEKAYGEVSYQLDYFPKNKITVVFYPLKEFHDHWKLPYRVNGYFDGKLRIPYADGRTSFAEMKPMIKHELTHAFVSALTPKSIPQWLNEGLAQWVEGKQMSVKSRDALVIYQITRRLPDLEHLDRALSSQQNPYNNTEMTLAYMKSLSVTEYLIEENGVWSVMQFIRGRGEGMSEEDLFQKCFHQNIKAIEEHWIRRLERQKSNMISH